MAVVFGGESRFVSKKSLVTGALFLLVFTAMWAAIDAVFFFSKMTPSGVNVAIVLVLGALAWALTRIAGPLIGRFNRFGRGLEGEASAVSALRRLPDSFAVFRGLKISEHQDIDSAIIGPTGLYAIEVKSHRGDIGYDGNVLVRNGRLLEKDFLSEATREAAGLRRIIKFAADDDAYIEAVVAFASPFARVRFGTRKVRNVFVVGRDWLPGLITNGPEAHAIAPERILKIATALAALIPDKGREKKIARLERALSDGSIG
jgi:hypothetical protein